MTWFGCGSRCITARSFLILGTIGVLGRRPFFTTDPTGVDWCAKHINTRSYSVVRTGLCRSSMASLPSFVEISTTMSLTPTPNPAELDKRLAASFAGADARIVQGKLHTCFGCTNMLPNAGDWSTPPIVLRVSKSTTPWRSSPLICTMRAAAGSHCLGAIMHVIMCLVRALKTIVRDDMLMIGCFRLFKQKDSISHNNA